MIFLVSITGIKNYEGLWSKFHDRGGLHRIREHRKMLWLVKSKP